MSRRVLVPILAVVLAVLLYSIRPIVSPHLRDRSSSLVVPALGFWASSKRYYDVDPLQLPVRPQEALRLGDLSNMKVAVMEHGGFHDEVLGAVYKVLEDIGVEYTLFRNGFRWGFEAILEGFVPVLQAPLNREKYAIEGLDGYDVTIFVSCDNRWRGFMKPWMENAVVNKTDMSIICIQHETGSFDNNERNSWESSALLDRVDFLTLSTHTSETIRRRLQQWSHETQTPTWAKTRTDTLLPIFPVEPLRLPVNEDASVPVPEPRRAHHVPSRVAIIGQVQPWRRNYQRFIDALYNAMLEAWGYEKPLVANTTFRALATADVQPFKLHLVGSKSDSVTLNVPPELEEVIIINSSLDYSDFYRLIASMDLIVPAFADLTYVKNKLSSSIPAAVISRVPVLATPMLLQAYSWLREPAVVMHSEGMSEVEAIRRLRLGIDPMEGMWTNGQLLPEYPSWTTDSGIYGSRAQWDRYHDSLYQYNSEMMKELLTALQRRNIEYHSSVGE